MDHQVRRENLVAAFLDITVPQYYNKIRSKDFVFPVHGETWIAQAVQMLADQDQLPDGEIRTELQAKYIQAVALMSDETLAWAVKTFHPNSPEWGERT